MKTGPAFSPLGAALVANGKGLAPSLANQVQQYAETVDASMSKAIALLVRLGLENQENRKREFFKRLKGNLASDDPSSGSPGRSGPICGIAQRSGGFRTFRAGQAVVTALERPCGGGHWAAGAVRRAL